MIVQWRKTTTKFTELIKLCRRCIAIFQHFDLIFVVKQWIFLGERSQMTIQAHTWWWRSNLWFFIHKIDWCNFMCTVHRMSHGISDTFYVYYLTTYSFNVIIYNEMQSQWIATFLHKMKRERERWRWTGMLRPKRPVCGNRQQQIASVNEKHKKKNDEMRISALHTYEFVCIIICFSVLFFIMIPLQTATILAFKVALLNLWCSL